MFKKALLVGINEYHEVQLRGCVNDVLEMQKVLTGIFGFQFQQLPQLECPAGREAAAFLSVAQ